MEASRIWARPAGRFIPIAEETGLIDAIGEWVLRSACTQMDAWYRRGLPRIAVSVNVSSRQFRQDSLANTVKAVLDDTGFDPKLLELELTESLLMDDIARSKTILSELKTLGVSIALDDFGTGYSSLSYLKGFQLDTLKIDRAFTAELTTSETNASIVRATIGLARGCVCERLRKALRHARKRIFWSSTAAMCSRVFSSRARWSPKRSCHSRKPRTLILCRGSRKPATRNSAPRADQRRYCAAIPNADCAISRCSTAFCAASPTAVGAIAGRPE